MAKLWIALNGCDDTTRFQMEVTEAEKAFVERMCAASQLASTYGCMPVMQCGDDEKPWDYEQEDANV